MLDESLSAPSNFNIGDRDENIPNMYLMHVSGFDGVYMCFGLVFHTIRPGDIASPPKLSVPSQPDVCNSAYPWPEVRSS